MLLNSKDKNKITINNKGHKITNIVINLLNIVDAFVALGGSRDKMGAVAKKTLIETIKNEFELTFDIESLIDSFPGDSLDYYSFCEIF